MSIDRGLAQLDAATQAMDPTLVGSATIVGAHGGDELVDLLVGFEGIQVCEVGQALLAVGLLLPDDLLKRQLTPGRYGCGCAALVAIPTSGRQAELIRSRMQRSRLRYGDRVQLRLR